MSIRKVLLIIDFSEEYGRGLLRGIAKYSQLIEPWAFCRMPKFNNSLSNIKDIIAWAREWGTDGIIAQIQDRSEADLFTNLNIPLISQDLVDRFADIPNITGQYRKTGRMAADYFLQRGFTKFAFYGFDEIVWSRERLEGYADALFIAGFEPFVFQHNIELRTPLWSYRQSPLVQWLSDLPKPIALFACDDNQGQHVLEACKMARISVPEQIAIIGVDNDEVVCNLSDPPLSSISLNTEKGGFEAAKLLDRMMRGDTENIKDIIVEPLRIEERRSSDVFAIEDKELSKAIRYIYMNFKDLISVNQVVDATALSRRVLEKRFVETFGKTILEKITDLRIGHVEKMLLDTDYTIAEIADLCGFTDEKNLSRYFKQRNDTTPKIFRKMNKIDR